MSNQQPPSKSNPWGFAIAGIILMVVGTYASLNVHLDFFESLNKQGIPVDLGKTLASGGVLLILLPVLRYFFITPLQEVVEGRNNELEATFAEAENLRTEMKKMKSDYEARLVQTEANAREQIQNQVKEAQNLRQQLMSEAAERADILVRQAQIEIEQEKVNAIQVIRTHVVDLTLAAAEKIIGENMDSGKNRRLIAEFIDMVEVAS
jgi:F-type H+-transporting ATPase subunit b